MCAPRAASWCLCMFFLSRLRANRGVHTRKFRVCVETKWRHPSPNMRQCKKKATGHKNTRAGQKEANGRWDTEKGNGTKQNEPRTKWKKNGTRDTKNSTRKNWKVFFRVFSVFSPSFSSRFLVCVLFCLLFVLSCFLSDQLSDWVNNIFTTWCIYVWVLVVCGRGGSRHSFLVPPSVGPLPLGLPPQDTPPWIPPTDPSAKPL